MLNNRYRPTSMTYNAMLMIFLSYQAIEPAEVSCLHMKIYMRANFPSLMYCVCVGRTIEIRD